jgi:hypothetical protein
MIAARQAVAHPQLLAPLHIDGDLAGDDAFLLDLDSALERPGTLELQPFDALTPHVREIRISR